MAKYSCKNCINLKTKRITKESLKDIKQEELVRAIKHHETETLGLSFPINLSVYKRVLKYNDCDIVYCSENMLKRNAYISKKNAEEIFPDISPCPQYK